MIETLQKRPFSRLLLVWIVGILAQVLWDVSAYLVQLFLIPWFLVLISAFVFPKEVVFNFKNRWLWGVLFCVLLFGLSVQKTALIEKNSFADTPELQLVQQAKVWQSQLLQRIDRLQLTEEEKSVFSAVTLGYKENMKDSVRNRFSTTGVAHILAVSGFHVVIVCGFLSCCFFFLSLGKWGRRIRYLLLVLLLWLFVGITGFAPSSVRAGLMLTFYLTGNVLGMTTERYNIWAASAFCMLVYNPFYLFDIGFQLSYLAVLSILYFQPRFSSLLSIRNPLLQIPWGWITVTVAAQLGTAFLCLYYFGQFSTVFLLTNLPLTFLATLLIPLGLLWMVWPVGGFGYEVLQLGVEKLTRAMFEVVDLFSQVPGHVCTFDFDFKMMCIGYAIGITLICLFSFRNWLKKSHNFSERKS